METARTLSLGYYHDLSNPDLSLAATHQAGIVSTNGEFPVFSLEEHLERGIILLFIADWVPVKRQLLLILEENLKKSYLTVDPEKSPLLLDRFSVITLPTLLDFQKGVEETRLIGAFGPHELGRLKTPSSR